MSHSIRRVIILILTLPFFLLSGSYDIQAQDDVAGQPSSDQQLQLDGATMCEGIKDYAPFNSAATFPISLGKVACYTLFDPVPEKAVIYHYWFRRDVLSTTIRLELKPPRWGAFSEIQLREADKGPWRVEVRDENGRLFKILRFSITE